MEGFRRNARARSRGVDHFFDQQERNSYDDLFAVHANLRLIASQDSSHQRQSQQVRNYISYFHYNIILVIYFTSMIVLHDSNGLFFQQAPSNPGHQGSSSETRLPHTPAHRPRVSLC